MSSAGGVPFAADVSGRMAVFGRLFGEQVGIIEPARIPTPESLLAVVKSHVPRLGAATDDPPLLEAAAYVGEWLRRRVDGSWIAEGPYEPHLQVVDASHAIVYLLPLVQMMRTASTAGYDGMGHLIQGVIDDVATPAARAPLDELRVEPADDREAVVAWVRANRDVERATRAALWRRCSVCAETDEHVVTLHRPGEDWEGEAATAAGILATSPFECDCGGLPGAATRFLMLRDDGHATRLGDIYVTTTHTRVGCWTLEEDTVAPFDALSLAADEAFSA